jgi:Protein of unknown function (DUF1573)
MNRYYLRIWWLALAAALFMGLVRCGDGGKAEQERKAAEERKAASRVPQITWRDLSYIDTVHVGDTILHDYVFYNTGWKPVVIKHAISNRPECTCQIPTREIPIGEQDTIKMTCLFTEVERVGVEIVIEHNTPQQSPILVYVATVEK